MEERVRNTVESLRKNGFEVKFFDNSNEAKNDIIRHIQNVDTVGIGGSMTVFDMNIYEELKEKGIKVYWHWKVPDEEKMEARNSADSSKIYITSTNAITEDGKLVNMDGVGNRVSSMFYGHEKIYIIAGINKICKDYEEARNRIRNIAAPKNAKRLKVDTPCAIAEKCVDCSSPSRICNVEVILHKKPSNANIFIFLVNEELGY
ncbi:lactate utilization protein [Sporanaerobacter acetigenes]|uniref:Uncharacterized ACR, YkgG family COG1556 n=1 Tax=Sporanaerobacter acetigenes DSM 13106 TaxID=1123281 RepID=A0A1M5Z5Q6_9FIRM|nr:lactate utilization protein [Sporanaerobacter acetigenes]SHI19484.1 Uncharacterised ACR, YkgG family COG1556 [Sporanaerobacter acetigenes DSM 13106]